MSDLMSDPGVTAPKPLQNKALEVTYALLSGRSGVRITSRTRVLKGRMR